MQTTRHHAPAAVASRRCDLSHLRGTFAEGYTDEDIDRVLPELSRLLGGELCCVWEYVDVWSPGGSSDLVAIIDGEARELPAGLSALLHEEDHDGPSVIDAAAIPAGPHSEINLAATCPWRSERGFSRALEDRR